MRIIYYIKSLFFKDIRPICPVYYVDFSRRKLVAKIGADIQSQQISKAA